MDGSTAISARVKTNNKMRNERKKRQQRTLRDATVCQGTTATKQNKTKKRQRSFTVGEVEDKETRQQLRNLDYVREWLDKHSSFDERDWHGIMKGVQTTPDRMPWQVMEIPAKPVSYFTLNGAKDTSITNTFPSHIALAVTRLRDLQRHQEAVLAKLVFPNKMVIRHLTYIITAFLRRLYFRIQQRSEGEQEGLVLGDEMHYATQAMIHRYFNRGLDKRIHLDTTLEREVFESHQRGGAWPPKTRDFLTKLGKTDTPEEEAMDVGDESVIYKDVDMKINEISDALLKQYEQKHEALITAIQDLYNGKKTLTTLLQELKIGSNQEHIEHHKAAKETASKSVNRTTDNGMGNTSDDDDDEEDYYISDNDSHASLELSGDEEYSEDVNDDERQCVAWKKVNSVCKQCKYYPYMHRKRCWCDAEDGERESSDTKRFRTSERGYCRYSERDSDAYTDNSSSSSLDDDMLTPDMEQQEQDYVENQLVTKDKSGSCLQTDYQEDGKDAYEGDNNDDNDDDDDGSYDDLKETPTVPEFDIEVGNRLIEELGCGSSEGDRKALEFDAMCTRQMQRLVTRDQRKKKMVTKFNSGRAAMIRNVQQSENSREKRKIVVEWFSGEQNRGKIREYVVKAVCRRNFVIFSQLWRRVKAIKKYPGLRLQTQDVIVWRSLRRQKAYLTDLLQIEREVLLYRLSKKYKVSCQTILDAQVSFPIIRKKKSSTAQIVEFLDTLPIRRVQYLFGHVFSKMEKESKEETKVFLDQCSVLLYLETLARLRGQQRAFPWVSHMAVYPGLRVYVEQLITSSDEDYQLCCKMKDQKARRDKVALKLKTMTDEKKAKYVRAAKKTYEGLVRKFLYEKLRYMKRYDVPEAVLQYHFPLYPVDDIGLMSLPVCQRVKMVKEKNKKQLIRRQEYLDMVKEKAVEKESVLEKMKNFLSNASDDDIILKVFDIQLQDKEWIQRILVLGDDFEFSEYKQSQRPQTTTHTSPNLLAQALALKWDNSSDEDEDGDEAWMEVDFKDEVYEDEERQRKEEEQRLHKMEPVTIEKVFQELHQEYFQKGNSILSTNTEEETEAPNTAYIYFEDRQWESEIFTSALDKLIDHLSGSKYPSLHLLNIDFQREIRRLWHYKPEGFLRHIVSYERLRNICILQQQKLIYMMEMEENDKVLKRNTEEILSKRLKGRPGYEGDAEGEEITNHY